MYCKKSDWNCPKCNVLIFGHKTECLKCKSQKPLYPSNKYVEPISIKPISFEPISFEQVEQESKTIVENYKKIQEEYKNRPPNYIECWKCRSGYTRSHNCWKYT